MKIRKIEISLKLEVDPKLVWGFISNIKTYKKFVKFLKKVERVDNFKVGSYWSDYSTVMFVRQLVMHEIIEIQEGRRVVYLIRLPFGGAIVQSLEVVSQGSGSKFILGAKIDFKNSLLDFVFGPVVEMRIREMYLGTIKNIERIVAEGDY